MADDTATNGTPYTPKANEFVFGGRHFVGWNTAADNTGDPHSAGVAFGFYYGADITLYAQWAADYYTVKFVDWDGTELQTTSVAHGAAATAPPTDPSRVGYTFSGWDPSDFSNVTGPMTMVAQYYANTYVVSFDIDGTIAGTQAVTYGSLVVRPDSPSKANYVFVGWYVDPQTADPTHATLWDFDARLIPPYDFTLFAHWEPIMFEVAFDSAGGSAVASQYVQQNSKAARPAPDPTFDGYSFMGWHYGAVLFDFDTPVTASITLTAAWTPNTYTVTFDSGGGSPIPSQNIVFGNLVAKPVDSILVGSVFLGWYVDDEAADPTHATLWDFDTRTIPPYDFTLYAHWAQFTYTVTFDSNGAGYPDEHLYNVPHGTVVSSSQAPTWWTMAGYVIEGWYKDAACTYLYGFVGGPAPEDAIVADTILYAKWVKTAYTVTVSYSVYTAPLDPAIPVPFGPDVDTYPVGVASDVPSWTAATNPHHHPDYELYGVRINGGTMVSPTVLTQTYFGTALTDNYRLDCDIEFIFNVKTFTVAFNCDGGGAWWSDTEGFGYQYIAPWGTASEPDAPTKTGYKFDYWYEMGAPAPYDFSTPVTRPVTLYAHWTIGTYNLTFNYTGDGLTPNKTIQLQFGERIPVASLYLEEVYPTLAGYDFLGWWCVNHYWDVDNETMPGYDIELLAQWQIRKYNVVYDRNNGTGVTTSELRDHGQKAIDYDIGGERAYGYSFGGWYIDAACTTPWDFDLPIIGDLGLFAKWNQLHMWAVEYDGGYVPWAGTQFEITVAGDPGDAYAYIDLNDVQFDIANVSDAGALWVDVYRNDAFVGASLLSGVGELYSLVSSLGAHGFFNGETITYIVYDGVWPNPAGVELGRAVFTIDIPVTITSTNGYFNAGTWVADYEVGVPAYAVYTKQLDSVTRTISGIRFNTTTAALGAISVVPSVSVSNAAIDETATWHEFTHDTVTITEPLYYYIYNGSALIGAVKINPQFQVFFDYSTSAAGDLKWLEHTDFPLYDTPVARPDDYDWTGAGYDFGGWFLDLADPLSEWDFNDGVKADMTLYAKYTIRTYTVTFQNYYGTPAPAPQTVDYNEMLVRPTDPELLGYTFDNWWLDEYTFSWDFGSYKAGVDNLGGKDELAFTLYAKWDKISYSVWYYIDGTYDHGHPAPVYYGDPVPNDAAWATKTGYHLNGWYKDELCTIPWDFATEMMPADDLKLYGKWDANDYTVTYVDWDGTPLWSEYVAYGGTITDWTPVMTGYTFSGWLDDVLPVPATWDPSWAIWRDITLTAMWLHNSYNLHWYIDGSYDHGDPKYYGDDVLEYVPAAWAGRTFSGWYTDAALTPGNEWDFVNWKMPDHNVDLYAEWTLKSYTVTFDNNYGLPAPAPQTKDYWSFLDVPAMMTNDGYTFGGWFQDAACTIPWIFAIDRVGVNNQGGEDELAFTLYAKWNKIEVGVDFFYNDSVIIKVWVPLFIGDLVPEPTPPTDLHYDFGGWFSDPLFTPGSEWDFSTPIMVYTALYAKWTPKTFTVKYNYTTHAGGYVWEETAEYLSDANYQYFWHANEIAIWCTDNTLTTAWDYATDKITGPTELFALWVPDKVVVFYDYGVLAPGFGWNHSSPFVASIGTTPHYAAIPDFSDADWYFGHDFGGGLIFLGWCTDPGLTTAYVFPGGWITGGFTVYAKYTDPGTPAVKGEVFVVNGVDYAANLVGISPNYTLDYSTLGGGIDVTNFGDIELILAGVTGTLDGQFIISGVSPRPITFTPMGGGLYSISFVAFSPPVDLTVHTISIVIYENSVEIGRITII